MVGKIDNLFVGVPFVCHNYNCINKNKIDQVFVGSIKAGSDNAAHQGYP